MIRMFGEFRISFSILFCISFLSLAQPPKIRFKYLGVNDGLSQGQVECILQDSENYMWFGTHYGLNKYNGYEFTAYKSDLNDSTSINHNHIVCLYEDSKKNLWIGTLDGLNRYDRNNDKFISYKYSPDKKNAIKENGIRAIYEDKQGNLWISAVNLSTNKGRIYLYDNHAGFIAGFLSAIGSEVVNSFYEDSNGNIWLGLDNGICAYNKINKSFKRYTSIKEINKNINGSLVSSIVEDHDHNMWITTMNGGVSVLDGKTQTFKHYVHNDNDPLSLGSNEINKCVVDRSGRIWLGGSKGGLHLYNALKDNFYRYETIAGNASSISNNFIQTLYEDKNGLIWLGMHSNGINLFSPQGDNFKHYKKEIREGGLSDNSVKAFCEDKQGNIWIGTDGGGLNNFDAQRNYFTVYKHTKDPKSIGSNSVLSILEDRYNNLWIGTWDGGLNLLEKKTNTFKHYYHNPTDATSISSNNICCAIEDKVGNLWVASYSDGLNLLDRKKDNFIRVPCVINNEQSRVACVTIDKHGLIWIGTNSSGVGVFDPIKRKLVNQFQYARDSKHSIGSNGIYSLYIDTKARTWIGTDKGINLYDTVSNNCKTYGLINDVILVITEDAKGNLWLSTLNGIVKFNPDLNTILRYTYADGLQGTEFIQNAAMKAKNGEMFFGGLNGFNVFHPDSLKDNTASPVHFTDFQIFNKSISASDNDSPLKQHVSQAKEITLSYKQSVISFQFAALEYYYPEKNQYAYKLEGFDKDWNYIGTKRSVTYTNLDPGKYTLKVKASNNNGVWNEQGASIKLTITPPFWKTWWMYTLYLLIVVTALYFFRKYSIIKIKVMNRLMIERLENKKIAEISEVKMRFFTNISHEIRTPLTLISSPLESVMEEDYLTSKTKKNLSSVQKNVKRLLDLTNQLLQFRKLDQGFLHLNASEVSITNFITELLEYFEQQAMLKNIDIKIQNKIAQEVSLWIDREMITTVFYNLIANALKFTKPGGSITITIFEAPIYSTDWLHRFKRVFFKDDHKNAIAIEVGDTGKGIPAKELKNIFQRFYQLTNESQETPGSGIGLSLVKEYIELHKGHIEVTSKLEHGTSFTIYLPKDLQIKRQTTNSSHVPTVERPDSLSIEENNISENGTEKPLVLIVEDDVELADHLRESLHTTFRVEVANNGKVGLDKALKILPDLIISDIAMPEMDGYSLCKELKSNIVTNHIPVILLTAKASEESVVLGYNYGADAYIPKPFNIKIIEAQGKSLIRSRILLREKYKTLILAEPSEIIVDSPDKEFLKRLMEIIEANIKNPKFDVPTLASEIGMSQSAILKKVKSLTGLSVIELIKSTKLKRAAMIFQKEKYSVSDVCYMVGFTDPNYFGKCFIKEFGKTPSEYINEYNALRMKDASGN